MISKDLTPSWFTIGDFTWPYHLAFWTGLLVALLGAVAASWPAGRTGPAQALREASVDTRAMTRGRWLFGAVLLLTAAVTLGLALVTDPGELLHRKTYISRPMLLITAVALLAPVLVRPLTRLIAWLPARLPGAGGMLVRENAAAGVRRTAAIAAPVLVTVALTGSLLGATATLNEARATETREQTAADFVFTPAVDTGFDTATLKKLRAVRGANVSATSSSAVFVTPANAPGASIDRVDVALADGADRATVAAALKKAGGQVLTKDQWVRASHPETNRTTLPHSRLRSSGGTPVGLLLVLGIALLYTGISVANTMVMATSDRLRDLAVLRLAGATRRQVLRLVGAEALTVVAVGGVLGLLVAGLNLLGMWSALGLLSVRSPVAIPWAELGAVLGACAVLAVVSSVVPAGLALHRATGTTTT